MRRYALAVAPALALAAFTAFALPSARAIAADQRVGVSIIRVGTDWRSLIAPGQTVTLDVGVSNLRGDAPAHDTTLAVLLQPGLSLKESRPRPASIETVSEGTRLTWNLGTIAARAFPRLFDLDLVAASEAKQGTQLAVEAIVRTTDNLADTRSAFAFSVVRGVADLVVETSLGGAPFSADDPVDFSIDVTNLGTIAAAGGVLTMMLPPKVAFQSSDPQPAEQREGRVTWKLGDLAPAQARSIKVEVTLDPILRSAAYGFAPKIAAQRFEFDATTTTEVIDRDHGRLEIVRYPEPAGSNVTVALNLSGVPPPGAPAVGTEVAYEIIYGNYGSAPADQVSVSLVLPNGLDLIDAAPAAARSNRNDKTGATTVSWDLGALGVGASGSVKARISVKSIGAEGSLVSAKISAAGNDASSRDKTASSLLRGPRP